MSTFILTLGVIAVIMTAMAVGVIFSDRALRGSCGGVGDDCACAEAAEESGEVFTPGSACEIPQSRS
jgi:hypothetical protein